MATILTGLGIPTKDNQSVNKEYVDRLGAMTKQQFEAIAENNRRKFDGSGFVEWGKHNDIKTWVINQGMWQHTSDLSVIQLGQTVPSVDPTWDTSSTSNSFAPIININGYILKLQFINNNWDSNIIIFPDPPDSADNLYREDLVLLESWHEKISDKDWFVPYGNVMYGATTYTTPDGTTITLDSITTALGSSYQPYSSFSEWDTTTVGYGKKWSDLTEAEKQSILADKWNNIYIDKDGEFVQVRYRIRVIPSYGSNDDLTNNQSFETGFLKGTGLNAFEIFLPNGNMVHARAQGSSVDSSIDGSSETVAKKYLTYDSQIDWSNYAITGAYANSDGGNPTIYGLVIATISRRNSGAYHAVYNVNGSAKFDDSGTAKFWYEYTDSSSWSITTYSITAVDQTNKQFTIFGDHTDVIKPDYYIAVSGSTGNDGRYYVTDSQYDGTNTIITVSEEIPDTTADGVLKSDFQYVKYCFDHATGGTISSGISGRPDGLYADEINERDVKDLRMPAKTDYSLYTESGATRVLNKYVANDVRGKERVSNLIPVNKVLLSNSSNKIYFYYKNTDFRWFITSTGDILVGVYYNGSVYYCKAQRKDIWGDFIIDRTAGFDNNLLYTDLLNDNGGTDGYYEFSSTLFIQIMDEHVYLKQEPGTKKMNWLKTTYNHILFHSDIIGDPANYPQAWKDFGIFGVPLIIDEDSNDYRPDGSNKTWKLSRKFSSIKLVLKYSGGSYTVLTDGTDYSTNSTANTITFTTAPATTDIIQIFYETYCNDLEPTANREVNGGVSDVMFTKHYGYAKYLSNFLINKVSIGSGNYDFEYVKWQAVHRINTNYLDSGMWGGGPSKHQSYASFDTLDSPAVKTFVYITEKNGALYPVFVFKELKYDSGTSSWGDNNKFEIRNYVGTMTDDNGNTVLYGQKIGKTPLGFVKNNIIKTEL